VKEHKHTGRTVAVLGGAGVLAWLVLRGTGKGKGVGNAATPPVITPAGHSVVWLRSADQIEVDGVVVDLPTLIARGRAVEVTEVHASGDARQGFVADVLEALSAAGIPMRLAPDLASIVPARVRS
jgi:hypothetical protein